MAIIYNASMFLYLSASRVAALFSPKAANFVSGHRGLIKKIRSDINSKTAQNSGKRYWFHCASVGEFEQARPLIEAIKEKDSSSSIVVTFFSPSGYNLRKNYSLADHVFYLPMDTTGNVRRFLDIVKPNVAIFIKYEFWKNYLAALKSRGIPVYLVSANFMKSQPFFKWWGGMFRRMLPNFTHIFVQDVGSEVLLNKLGYNRVTIAGDSRFDRVIKVAFNNASIPELELFTCNGNSNNYLSTLIAGSTWPEDEEMLLNFMNRFYSTKQGKLKLVIVPHQPTPEGVEKIKGQFTKFGVVKYSEVKGNVDNPKVKESTCNAGVLIIDTVGMLSASYKYGSFAYVGGGFGAGIHNTLEPAAFGLPVVFGPKHQRFIEADGLLSCGGGFAISNTKGYMPGKVDIMNILAVNKSFRDKASEYCSWYINKHKGATERIMTKIIGA